MLTLVSRLSSALVAQPIASDASFTMRFGTGWPSSSSSALEGYDAIATTPMAATQYSTASACRSLRACACAESGLRGTGLKES
eukprot:15602-Heterococcus_DN1.PRE.4